MKILNTISAFIILLGSAAIAENTLPGLTAIDGRGREIGTQESYGKPRKDKFAGMFYCIWQGSHGYDKHTNNTKGVVPPTPEDVNAPYDNQKLIDRYGDKYQEHLGPMSAFHHWGEPYLGYYVADDEWVIRKHAQMLSDAGIDTIIIDATNSITYLDTVRKICKVFTQMRREGNKTPQISFVLNSGARNTLRDLYDNFYSKGEYPELWFRWKGKPLVFAPPDAFDPDTAEFFTARQAWFNSKEAWFGDGKDKCPWADVYPQKYGWHESPDKPEMISVSPATHPINIPRIGRSYHNGAQPGPEGRDSGAGLCFEEQFSMAMETDPEFIFFSGWNEWIAMRLPNGGVTELGDYKLAPNASSMFVDLFNHEYSRDIEPLRGGFGDSYYYQLADFVRKFKGVEKTKVVSRNSKINLDNMKSWNSVGPRYKDDKGDTFHRKHFGYGYKLGTLTNDTGRNDIVECKVANDGENLFFYAECADNITPRTGPKWMRLFIKINGNDGENWEGFQFFANAAPESDAKTTLAKSKGGWDWEKTGDIEYKVDGNKIALKIPHSMLGVENPDDISLDFKWVDNAIESGDIQECLTDGDSAPNGRFRYRYEFAK